MPVDLLTQDPFALDTRLQGFDDLVSWLSVFEHQRDVDHPRAVPNAHFKEEFVSHVCRDTPDDLAFGEMIVANRLAERIGAQALKDGTLIWRTRPEMAYAKVRLIKSYADNGEHVDFLTDKKFHAREGDFLIVKGYARFAWLERKAEAA